MSNNRKNNHYHYAEKYDRVIRRKKSSRTAYLPFKTVIASLVVLLMFGLVSTTFGAYITESEPDYNPEEPGIISEVRNIKATRDTAITGRNVSLAETGATWSFSGGYLYFEKPSTWTTNISSIQLVIGKGTSGSSSWSECYTMSKITNTNYYVVSLPSSGWGDATYMAVIGNSSAWGGGQWGTSNLSNASNKTSAYTSGLSSSANQRYIFDGSTMDYKGTDNSSMSTVSLAAHACYSTNGTSYTADNATGGTVSITSYYFNNYNSVTTSSTGASATATYSAAKVTANSSFVAAAASGYRFVGWFTAATGGSSVSTSTTYSYATTGGDKTVYARFIKRNTVTIAKNPTAYTGSPTAGGSTSSTTVDAGSTVALAADVKTGVTFSGWTFSNTSYSITSGSASSASCTIKPTANLTATAKYTLQVPTSLSLSYPTIVAGNTSAPTKSATSPSSGTLTYSFTNITPKSGTTAAAGTYSVNSSTGVVTASTPGKYTVTMSVTTTNYGLTSAAATTTAEVTVKPVAPTAVTIEASNATSGSGTYAEPYKIPINKTKFNIKAYIPIADRNANYSYNWTRTDGTYLLSNGNITAGTSSATTANNTEVTDTASATTTDVIHNYACETTKGYIYKIAVYSEQNGVQSDPYYPDPIYYGVTADFLVVEQFDYEDFNDTDPIQKIYAEDNTIDHINASYDVGGTTFDTMLFYSTNNINFNKVAVWTDRGEFTLTGSGIFNGTHSPLPAEGHAVHDLIEEISVIARNNVNLMLTTGPKWFRGYIDDYGNGNIAAQTPELHTTVGTSSTVADRPIYYLDNTGITYTNSRIMAFYLRESDATPTVRYQTAQQVKRTVNGTEVTYNRFYIPEDATQITFAHVANNNYVLPTINNGTLTYTVYTDHTVLMAWTTPIDLTDSANVGKTLYKATAYTTGANDINNYTGSMLTLD